MEPYRAAVGATIEQYGPGGCNQTDRRRTGAETHRHYKSLVGVKNQ